MLKQGEEHAALIRVHGFLFAIGAEAAHAAAHKEPRLIETISKTFPWRSQNDQIAFLGHERAHVANRAADDDVDPFHRDSAPRPRIALDHQQPASPGRAGTLARIAAHPDITGHHVLGHTDTSIAADIDPRLAVESPAIIADMTVDSDFQRSIYADRDCMATLRIPHRPAGRIGTLRGVMQPVVEVAHADRHQINHCCRRSDRAALTPPDPKDRRDQVPARIAAPPPMPGNETSARYSEPNAT